MFEKTKTIAIISVSLPPQEEEGAWGLRKPKNEKSGKTIGRSCR
jgi:hypothetical protein